MQQTTNYALKKIELTDSPPDITVINPNWDTIDMKLKENTDVLATHMADDVAHNRYGVATGTNTLAVTLSPAPTALKAGVSLRFKNTTANTGAVTLNINGLSAKSIVKNGGIALSSGNLKAGGVYGVLYDGTSFILQGEGGGGGVKTAQWGFASIPSDKTTIDIPISYVDPIKSVVRITETAPGGSVQVRFSLIAGDVLNAYTLRLTRGATGVVSPVILWEVFEFEGIKSIQKGTYYSWDEYLQTEAISIVDVQKSIVFCTIQAGANNQNNPQPIHYFLYSNNNVRLQALFKGDKFFHWAVVEFE